MRRAYGVVTKGNGDAFINEQTHTSLSIGGGQAGQGYPCVLILNPSDSQGNQVADYRGIYPRYILAPRVNGYETDDFRVRQLQSGDDI